MAKSNFIVRGGADFSGIQKEMNKTEKQFKGFEGKINKAFGGIAGGMGLNLGKLSKFALIGMAARELYKFGKASIQVASDLQEVQNVVDVTFGAMSKDVNDFASNSIKQFGLSELSAKKYASTMGAMLKSSGLKGTVVKDMSIDLAKLSADMASFYNLQNDVAFEKIMSGMSGMTQPLKELGINMNIANLEAYALSQGIKKKWQNMSQAEQTLIRYNYLLNVTSDSQGDFAKNAGSWANQVKILNEQWKEFMGLIGKGLMEVLLPVVKFLNNVLEILIKVTKEIGKIYTMITGKKATVEVNNDIADTSMDAAEGEVDLSKGIDKAAKSAKKALAPFDELNILQNNLSSGGGGGLGDILGGGGTGQLSTNMTTVQVDNGLEESKKKWEGFFIWIGDWWNKVKQTFAVPITVPAPVFATIPNPVYRPNWGLEPPLVPKPVFQPIPSPVYNPNWNLVPPTVPVPVFPAINYTNYNKSLQAIEIKTAETRTKLEGIQAALSKKLEEETSKSSERIKNGLSTAWNTIETNYSKHKENMGVIAAAVSTVLLANTNQGLSKLGINTNNTITATQNNWQTWGKNLGGIAVGTAKSFAANVAEGFKVTATNTVNFANNQLNNLKTWGSGVLGIAAETAKGFASNMISGFSTVWDNFKSLMSGMGEKVSGWFSANKKVITTTAIVAGVAIGAGALALAAPAAIPYIGATLGGLASIPALAKGGITNGPTMALIGDNPGGKEVVSPLDGLLDMIVEAVSTTNNQSGGDTTIIVKIGEDTITEKVVSNINRQSRISGKTVITV